MKIIAVINTDFDISSLGLPVRLDRKLNGVPVLRRTCLRVLSAEKVTSVHITVAPDHESRVRGLVEGLDVRVDTHNGGPVPWREFIACARKWSLDAWRGGLAGSNIFDETLHPWVGEALAQRESADGVVAVHPAACLIDPRLIDELIGHYENLDENIRLAFTQTAPGLSAGVFMGSLLGDLCNMKQPLGRAMAYYPKEPQRDMTMQSCFCNIDAPIMQSVGRCLADTEAGRQRVAAILDELGDDPLAPDAAAIARWLRDHQYQTNPLPDEVEIELTTDDPLPETTLRPRGASLPQRGPMSDDIFHKLIDELADHETARVVLGGFGDPLMHPQFAELIEYARRKNIYALAVRTPGVHLDTAAIDLLFNNNIDVINVTIDAATPDTYRRLHHADHFDRVQANVHNVLAQYSARQVSQPLLVCEMMKTRDTLNEIETFYDNWMLKTSCAVLAGPSHYAGQRPDLSVMCMAPPSRRPCARLWNRVIVLADGTVPACDQDFHGTHPMGRFPQQSLTDIWTGAPLTALRQSHLDGSCNAMPLCSRCDEWHRP